MNEKFQFLITASGIFFCYSVYGVIHEKITQRLYGDEPQEDGTKGERFSFAVTLVFIECVFHWIFAKAILTVRPQEADKTHYGYYICGALTHLLAMVFSNKALRWVSYPAQVVAKAAKPVPVMILCVLLGKQSYTKQRYLFVLIIVTGIVTFMYKDGKVNENHKNVGLGEFLLFMSLFMNGLSGAVQERMRAVGAPSGEHMMLSINGWSAVILPAALLITGEAFTFAQFATKHPEVILHLLVISLVSALGQIFIFKMISNFGSLPCSIVTTSRKFFTVLFSVLVLGNNLSLRQWIATFVVFGGLFADVIFGRKPKETIQESLSTSKTCDSVEVVSKGTVETEKIQIS